MEGELKDLLGIKVDLVVIRFIPDLCKVSILRDAIRL
jgi:predicted nucleotidyltransferase